MESNERLRVVLIKRRLDLSNSQLDADHPSSMTYRNVSNNSRINIAQTANYIIFETSKQGNNRKTGDRFQPGDDTCPNTPSTNKFGSFASPNQR